MCANIRNDVRSDEGLRWGILATGGIAGSFASDLIADGHRLTAVGSRTKESADAFARQWGIDDAHGSYRELLTSARVDVVYVATPHPWHAELAIAALEAGKHVLVEKPLAMSAAEARSIRAAAAANGRFAMEAMWTRFLPHMRRIVSLVRSGTLGTVTSLFADHVQQLPADETHRVNASELGGGALLDLGIYPVSFASQLLGPARSVTASAVLSHTGVDAQVAVVTTHEGGAIATSLSSMVSRGACRAVIAGTQGRIEIDRVWYMPTGFTVYDAANQVIERFEPAELSGRGMQFEARHVEEMVAAGNLQSDVMSLDESVQTAEVLDAVRERIEPVRPAQP